MLSRHANIDIARITGWNAIKSRANQLGVEMTDDQFKECTAQIKRLADIRPVSLFILHIDLGYLKS